MRPTCNGDVIHVPPIDPNAQRKRDQERLAILLSLPPQDRWAFVQRRAVEDQPEWYALLEEVS